MESGGLHGSRVRETGRLDKRVERLGLEGCVRASGAGDTLGFSGARAGGRPSGNVGGRVFFRMYFTGNNVAFYLARLEAEP